MNDQPSPSVPLPDSPPTYFKFFKRPDESSRSSGGFCCWVAEFQPLEVTLQLLVSSHAQDLSIKLIVAGRLPCCAVAPVGHLVHLPDKVHVDSRVKYCLHHGKVFKVVMSLKQRVAREEFDENASYAPNVAWKRPAKS